MLDTKPQVFIATGPARQGSKFQKLVNYFFKTNRILTLFGLMMLVSLAGSLTGLLLDNRTLQGVPIWDKPVKFSISLMLYVFTLTWMLSYIKGHPRLVRIISWVTAVAFFAEMSMIIMQVIRGVSSHFNRATDFDAAVFSIMGGFIMVFWLVNLGAAILLLFQRFDNPAFAWALRLGLLLALVGALLAMLMTVQRTPEQQLAVAAGQKLLMAGGHSVGVNDGGPGLPFVGWSTVGGDLRVPHFIGLHALQIVPLLGWLFLRLTRNGFSRGHQFLLVWIAGLGYGGLIAILTWQALRGQSVVAPDVLTLGAFAALLASVWLLTWGVIAHARLNRASY